MKVTELVGRNVQQARKDADLSQFELGRRVGKVLGKKDWFAQAVSAAERGDRDWAAEDLVAVAHALGHPVAWFFKVPADASPDDELDLGGALVPLEWVSGEATAPRTPKEITAEIARLTKELQRVITTSAAAGDELVVGPPTPEYEDQEARR